MNKGSGIVMEFGRPVWSPSSGGPFVMTRRSRDRFLKRLLNDLRRG